MQSDWTYSNKELPSSLGEEVFVTKQSLIKQRYAQHCQVEYDNKRNTSAHTEYIVVTRNI